MQGQTNQTLSNLEHAVSIWTGSTDRTDIERGRVDHDWMKPKCDFFVAVRALIAEVSRESSLNISVQGTSRTDNVSATAIELLTRLCDELKRETSLVKLTLEKAVSLPGKSEGTTPVVAREEERERAKGLSNEELAIAVFQPHGVFLSTYYTTLLSRFAPQINSTQEQDTRFREEICDKLFPVLFNNRQRLSPEFTRTFETGTFRFSILTAAYAHVARAAIRLASWDGVMEIPGEAAIDLKTAMQCLHFVYPLLTEPCQHDTKQWESAGLKNPREYRGTLSMRKLPVGYSQAVPRSAWLSVQHILTWLFNEPPQPADDQGKFSSTAETLNASIWMQLIDSFGETAVPYPLGLHLGPGDQNGCFFDVINSGQILFDGEFLESLNIAIEVSEGRLNDRQTRMKPPLPQVLRIAIPSLTGDRSNEDHCHTLREIEGDSAGGLAGCAMLSLTNETVPDPCITGSFTIRRKFYHRATSQDDIELASVDRTSLPWKVRSAARGTGANGPAFQGFLILDSPDQCSAAVQRAAEQWPGELIRLVTIDQALKKMQRRAAEDALLRELLGKMHRRWLQLAEPEQAAPLSSNDKTMWEDHRFECYVPPDFVIQNTAFDNSRMLQKAANARGDDNPEPADETKTDESEKEVRVPGGIFTQQEEDSDNDSDPDDEEVSLEGTSDEELDGHVKTTDHQDQDEPLRHLLRLIIRPNLNDSLSRWPDMPEWLQKKKRTNQRLRLVGSDNAGSGKTVFTHRLMHVATDEETWRELFEGHPPIVVRKEGEWPRKPDGDPFTIREFLFAGMKTFRSDKPADLQKPDSELERAIKRALDEKQVLIIIDGYDQFTDADQRYLEQLLVPDGRDDLSDDLSSEKKLAQDHCHWVITGRVHAVGKEAQRKRLFDPDACVYFRIEPFDEPRQDAYFEKTGSSGIRVSHRWKKLIGITDQTSRETVTQIRARMNHLLQIPMNLVQLRRILENTYDATPLPVFRTLGELSVVVGRLMLLRTLTDKRGTLSKILGADSKFSKLPILRQLENAEQLLAVVAFQMMLEENYNFRVAGSQLKHFRDQCQIRFAQRSEQNLRDAAEEGNRTKEKQANQAHDEEMEIFDECWKVLVDNELEIRSITEVFHDQGGIEFRGRKVMEACASRYLTRYATEHDIWGKGQGYRDCTKNDPDHRCAFDFSNDRDWEECWRLATEMPRHENWHPVRAPEHYAPAFQDTHLDPVVTCRSLGVLFEQPKKEIRPTELMYCAWPFFEYDDRLMCERLFLVPERNELVFGAELSPKDRRRLGEALVLPGADKVIEERFRSSNQTLMKQILENTAKFDRVPPRDSPDHATWLREWERQSSDEKSKTFLQCPPESWLQNAAMNDQTDPLITAIGDNESEFEDAKPRHIVRLRRSFWSLATPVTLGVYQEFDGAFVTQFDLGSQSDAAKENREHFPVVNTNWWDSYMFCKWLGREYWLPSKFQHEFLLRGGNADKYCFNSYVGCLEEYDSFASALGDYAHAVGLSRSNAYGQFDFNGHIEEWSHDWYNESWYQQRNDKTFRDCIRVVHADIGPSSGMVRSVQGGVFCFGEASAASFHSYCAPGRRGSYVGFRVVRDRLSPESS